MRARRAPRAPDAEREVGEILVTRGVVDGVQLKEALRIRRGDPRPLGEILLSLGYAGAEDLAKASAERLGLDYLHLNEGDVEREALSLVDRRLLRRHGAVPLRVENGRLLAAMSDPTDFFALEDLVMLSGYPVTPVVVTEEAIRATLDAVLEAEEDFGGLIQGNATPSRAVSPELGDDADHENPPIVRLVGSILRRAIAEGASDVHIEPRGAELAVRLRVDGLLRETMSVSARVRHAVVARVKILGDLDIAEKRLPQDGRFSVTVAGKNVDLRVATLPTAFGEKAVLRVLDTGSVELDLGKLGFSREVLEAYEEVFRRPYGTVLVVGPTGSGKSTTLHATIREISSPERNIITIEDPIEYRVQGLNQVQVNPKIGLTFASGLRSILRSDPDVVMIGEIRDFETAKTSIEAALTGHLVLATLHTNDAPGAVTRLTEMGVEPFLTASAVDCVIAQRLARRLCGACKRPTSVDGGLLRRLGLDPNPSGKAGSNFHEAVGCDTCGGTGYRGRIGVYEMLRVGDEVRDLILRRAPAGALGHAAEETGMVRLREDGLSKAASGITTIEEILRTVV
jgi:type IV pilus assembly protein PilB